MRPFGHRPREPESLSAMITYLLKSALVLTALYLLYSLTLRGKTLHRTGRLTLLATLAASLLLPAVPLRLPEATWTGEAFGQLAAWEAEGEGTEAAGLAPWVGRIYLAGLALLLVHYALSLVHLSAIVRGGRLLRRVRRVRIITHSALRAPASWLRWILLDRGSWPGLPTAVVRHELAHIRLGHSFDRLACDLAVRLLWFCPFAWLLRRELIQLHEFEADARVVAHGTPRKAYSRLLVNRTAPSAAVARLFGRQPAAPAWQAGEMARRLRMLYAAPTPSRVALRSLLALPVSIGLLLVMAQPEEIGKFSENEQKTLRLHLARASRHAAPAAVREEAPVKEEAPAATAQEAALQKPSRLAAKAPAAAPVRRVQPAQAAGPAMPTPQQLARQAGLDNPERYVAAVMLQPEGAGADVPAVYLVDGLRVSRERFERYAALLTDAAGNRIALATAGAASLAASPRDLALEHYGVDAPVFSLETSPLPPANDVARLEEVEVQVSPGLSEVVLVCQDAQGNRLYRYLR